MSILWNADEPMTANQIVADIFRNYSLLNQQLPNYTTVASLLTRLVSHGLLASVKVSARNIVYSAVIGRKKYAQLAIQQIAVRILGEPSLSVSELASIMQQR